MLDVNTATKKELVRIRGITDKIADAIILARPLKSFRDLLGVRGIGERLLKSLERQILVVSGVLTPPEVKPDSTLPKHPAWSPRPVSRIIPGDRPQLMVLEPRTRVAAGFDLTDPRIPLVYLSTEDESAVFEIENNSPRFRVKTKTGEMKMDVDGIKIETSGKTKAYPWKETKKIVRILAKLAMDDPVYGSIGVRLGAGLRVAVSSTRGVESSIGGVISSVVGTAPGGSLTGGTVWGGVTPLDVAYPGNCTLLDNGQSIVEDSISVGQRVVECTPEIIENIVEKCISPIPDCLARAARRRNRCRARCNRRFRRWYNRWLRGPCKGLCWIRWGIDVAVCLVKALICAFITTVETVYHCVTESGWVPDEPTRDCDIRLYEADGVIGEVINYATCGYGYSHSALVCGDEMIHATADGVVSSPTDYYADRKFAVVRLGLTSEQCGQLCACVEAKKGADYDHLEAVTFGTVDDPGREICTMLIMNCLDEIGVDRDSFGLGGFVSPNDIARRMGAPNANNL